MSFLTRRKTLKLALTSFTGCSLLASRHAEGRDRAAELANKTRGFSVSQSRTLREQFASKGLVFGASGNLYLEFDPFFAEFFAQECGILVPENELKWLTLRPAPDQFDFSGSDSLYNFARSHQMLIRGHTLVWEQALPSWFTETVNRSNAEQILINHIETVVKRYAGRFHSWDVVNEAIAASYSNRSDSMSESPWLKLLGKDYVNLAFEVAASVDRNALLVYNDRWLDYDIPRDNAQRRAVLKLLEYLKSRNSPVHALGIQAHLDAGETRFNANKFRQFLHDVASLGLKIIITELDVKDDRLPADITIRDRIVAATYEDYLNVVLDEPAVIAVLTWGLSDRYTWLSQYAPRDDGLPVRPLPLDENMNRKLAWHAISRAIDNVSKT